MKAWKSRITELDLGRAHTKSVQGGGHWPDCFDDLAPGLFLVRRLTAGTLCLAVITHLGHLPQDPSAWSCHWSTGGDQRPGGQRKLPSSSQIPNFHSKPLYSHHTGQTLIQIPANDRFISTFFQFSEKVICAKFILISVALFHNKMQNFYLDA